MIEPEKQGIGHGKLGYRDRIRTYMDLAVDAGAHRKPYLDLTFGLELTDPAPPSFAFTNYFGSIYYTTIDADWLQRADNEPVRPIVGIDVQKGSRVYSLVRKEQIGDLTAGTWFFNEDELLPGGSALLYIWMPDSTDPDTGNVVALVQFSYAVESEVHPLFGDEKFNDPDFDIWPTVWGTIGSGHSQETSIVGSGLSAAKVSGVFGNNTQNGYYQFGTCVQNGLYRVSGYYYTPPEGLPAGVSAKLRVGTTTPRTVMADGRNITGSAYSIPMRETRGDIRRFMLDYIWGDPSTNNVRAEMFLENTSGGFASGTVIFDRVSFRRIYRFIRYSGDLNRASVPSLTVQAKSIHFLGNTVGVGGVKLNNGEQAQLNRVFAGLHHAHKPAKISVGGSFQNGEEIHADDWRGSFAAITGRPTFDASGVSIALTNAHELAVIPSIGRPFRSQDAGELDTKRENAPRLLVFGSTDEYIFNPVRMDLTANNYPVYQYIDHQYPIDENVDVVVPPVPGVAAGNFGFMLKSYPNREKADLDLLGYEHAIVITSSTAAVNAVITTATDHGLVSGQTVNIYGHTPTLINGARVVTVISSNTFSIPVNTTGVGAGTGGKFVNTADFSMSHNNTRLTVLRDLRDMRYDRGGNDVGGQATFNWTIGGAILGVTFDVQGPPYRVAAYLTRLMNAVSGTSDILVSYSESTHKFTVAKTFGTLTLIMIPDDVAAESTHKQSWKLLGYTTTANRTGALAYLAENALYTDPETDLFVRMTGGGYKDDALGTITGTAGEAIEYAATVYTWLLQKACNIPARRIKTTEFKAARTAQFNAFEKLFVVLDRGMVRDALDKMSQVGLMTVNVDGDGYFRCKRYTAGVTAGVRDIYQHDIKSLVMWEDHDQVYKEVRIHGAWHPTFGEFKAHAQGVITLRGPEVKHGTEKILNIEGFYAKKTITDGVEQLSTQYARLATKVPRLVTFVTQGKLVDLLIGDKVRITYAGPEVMDPSGALNAVVFRIFSLKKDYYGDSMCSAVEDLLFLTDDSGEIGGGRDSGGGGDIGVG